MPPQFLRHGGVGIAVLAAGKEVPAAHEALAAGDAERHHDAVAGLELLDTTAGLDDFAHELMAQDVAALHRGNETVVEMQIGPADGGGGDPDDGVARVDDGGVRHLLDPDGPLAFPAGRLHDTPPVVVRTSVQWAGRAGRGLPSTVASEWTTSPSSSTCLSRRRSLP